MTQYISHKPRRTNDRNWAVTMILVAVGIIGTAFATGYFWTRHWNAQQELQAQKLQYETYQANTRPALTPAAAVPPAPSPEAMQARAVRERLLNHPNVIPGRGFDKPGVQSTAIAIVDAIDEAQSQQRTR